jgi:hypothetical protein
MEPVLKQEACGSATVNTGILLQLIVFFFAVNAVELFTARSEESNFVTTGIRLQNFTVN